MSFHKSCMDEPHLVQGVSGWGRLGYVMRPDGDEVLSGAYMERTSCHATHALHHTSKRLLLHMCFAMSVDRGHRAEGS